MLKYAQQHDPQISDFIKIEISSRKDTKARRIDELLSRMNRDDILLVAELSRLGRNMFEVINIINQLSDKGMQLIFVRQPELSTAGPHGKLLLAIYSYFAQAEREYISMRTRQGLAAAKARGKLLGRPKGSRNKTRILDPYKTQISSYLQMGLNLASILKIINHQLTGPVSYNGLKYFVQHDDELLKLWREQRGDQAGRVSSNP